MSGHWGGLRGTQTAAQPRPEERSRWEASWLQWSHFRESPCSRSHPLILALHDAWVKGKYSFKSFLLSILNGRTHQTFKSKCILFFPLKEVHQSCISILPYGWSCTFLQRKPGIIHCHKVRQNKGCCWEEERKEEMGGRRKRMEKTLDEVLFIGIS